MINNIREADFTPELIFVTSRSGGKGGQNVNKVSTKVALRFDVGASSILTEEQRNLLLEKLSGKLTAEGILQVVADSARTQLENRSIALEKFLDLLERSLKKQKPRRATAPTKASREKKLAEKRIQSQKKKSRSEAPDIENPY
jgi:ribosome-associated protein